MVYAIIFHPLRAPLSSRPSRPVLQVLRALATCLYAAIRPPPNTFGAALLGLVDLRLVPRGVCGGHWSYRHPVARARVVLWSNRILVSSTLDPLIRRKDQGPP